MSDCLFCKINQGEISADILYQDDNVTVFKDVSPQAPVHFLVIPKKHISTINDLQVGDEALIGQMMLAAKNVAADLGITEGGFRTTMNCNPDGGQSVYHIHLHVLGGRQMTWPPG